MSSVTGNRSIGPKEVIAAATNLEELQEQHKRLLSRVPLHRHESPFVQAQVWHLQDKQTEQAMDLRALLLLYTQRVADSLEGKPDQNAESLRRSDGTSGFGANQESLSSQQHSAQPDSMSGHSGGTHSAREL